MRRFLSCDWGTSSFRLRLVDTGKKEITAELFSDEGMAETYQQWVATGRPETERIDFYKTRLSGSISKLSVNIDNNLPVIISGMVSSSIGLKELPYQKFPFSWDKSQFGVEKIEGDKNFSHPLFIIPGFKTDVDVMRGEETKLLGCALDDDGEKIFIFPGTHSKHVFVKNKTGLDFKTYMTGEIFNLLIEKSILSNAVKKGMDEKSYIQGFKAGLAENILHQAFRVRTRQLLQRANEVSNYQYLSGLLIGAELKDLKDKGCPLYLVCGEHLKQAYLSGLELLGAKKEIHYLSADEMLIRGHCKLADQFL
jgi:2-dehydro-3-deoxygalactonokinase